MLTAASGSCDSFSLCASAWRRERPADPGRMAMTYVNHYDSPLGSMTMASDGRFLTGLWFDGQKHYPENINDEAETADLPVFGETVRWLDIYFSGRDPGFAPGISVSGTPFRIAVWDILRSIPYGKTMTYGEIAAEIGARGTTGKMSAQAVGGAAGHNQISLIIPCHRVVGADGNLTGYAGGIERKAKLLALENSR